ncbi:outer membrane insertion C-terminal signal [Sulfurimonas autotrophica DSM 16294]|uniref:Outer membrane insertion C-terminal signal n=2 Tax=Sulfurimonas autotrophica TaxID=202747 RepID=E0UUC6_SULAO|nr:outer membrane insertion C-terminal signal [Sulfurimonas autotrophica DSM 16294]
MAANNGVYVGFDVGSNRISMDSGNTHIATDNSGMQTVKIGYNINYNNRIAIFYQHINLSDGNGYSYGVNYDYLFSLMKQTKLFVGASFGHSNLAYNDTVQDMKGLIYGGEFGLLYDLNKYFSLEVGYRAYKSNVDSSDTNIKVNNIQNWYAGLNYQF